MHYARIEQSDRLQRLHAFLARPGWHTTRDINLGAEVMAVNSAVTELRANGAEVECRQQRSASGRRVWAYCLRRPAPGAADGRSGAGTDSAGGGDRVAGATTAPAAARQIPHSPDRRRRLLSAIHAEAKSRGISEPARRELQMRVAGADSCAKMSLDELGRVLDAIKRSGSPTRIVLVNSRADSSTPKLHAKIKAQCRALGVSDGYAGGIARQMFGSTVEALNPTQLRAVITALAKKQAKS